MFFFLSISSSESQSVTFLFVLVLVSHAMFYNYVFFQDHIAVEDEFDSEFQK